LLADGFDLEGLHCLLKRQQAAKVEKRNEVVAVAHHLLVANFVLRGFDCEAAVPALLLQLSYVLSVVLCVGCVALAAVLLENEHHKRVGVVHLVGGVVHKQIGYLLHFDQHAREKELAASWVRKLGVSTRAEGNVVLAVCGGSVGHHAAETQVLEHVFELLRVSQFKAACEALIGLVRELLTELEDTDEGRQGGDRACHDHLVELLVSLGAQFANLNFVKLVQVRGVGLLAREAAIEHAREVVQ
jgi:hypothetical protein